MDLTPQQLDALDSLIYGNPKHSSASTTWRYRVSVDRTSTGKWSFSSTVEAQGASMEATLAESDRLVEELQKRYGGI